MSLKRTIKRVFFPEVCHNCGRIIPITKSRCDCGFSDVFRLSEGICEHCGSEKEFCCCHYAGSAFLPHVTAPFLYTGAIRDRIHDLKFNNKPEEAEFFGSEMSVWFSTVFPYVQPDYVTFVPMTKSKLLERGYNQSELLAEEVSNKLSLEKVQLLFKVKDTLNQHNLSKRERLTNLNNAFSFNNDYVLDGKTVLICDDIKTTGTTLKKCCDVLFSAGVKDVYCLCAAITDYFVPIEHVLRTRIKTRSLSNDDSIFM